MAKDSYLPEMKRSKNLRGRNPSNQNYGEL